MSVVRDTTTSHDISTNAGFRAWATVFHNALGTVGLVQTADANQVNLATVVTPSANSSYTGYEVWKFNDANQAADPIYFRIDYGRAGAASAPSLKIQVGTGSDNNGNLLNNQSLGGIVTGAATPSGTPEIHICHVDGSLVLMSCAAVATASTVHLFILERFRNSSGAVITSGASMGFGYLSGYGQNAGLSGIRMNGGAWQVTRTVQPLGIGTGADPDSRKRLGPFTIDANYPWITTLLGLSGQISAGDSGLANIYATNRTYRVMTLTSLTSIASVGGFGGASQTPILLLLNE